MYCFNLYTTWHSVCQPEWCTLAVTVYTCTGSRRPFTSDATVTGLVPRFKNDGTVTSGSCQCWPAGARAGSRHGGPSRAAAASDLRTSRLPLALAVRNQFNDGTRTTVTRPQWQLETARDLPSSCGHWGQRPGSLTQSPPVTVGRFRVAPLRRSCDSGCERGPWPSGCPIRVGHGTSMVHDG